MDIFMSNISFFVNLHDLIRELTSILHKPPYTDPAMTGLPLNFNVRLLKNNDRRIRGSSHGGKGFLTLPTEAIAERFLDEYGDRPAGKPSKTFTVHTRIIKFSKANKPAPKEVVERTQRLPYEDPSKAEERERRDNYLKSNSVAIMTIQSGWETRHDTYSVEWEHSTDGNLSFDNERREFRIGIPQSLGHSLVIAIRPSQILEMSAHLYRSTQPVIFFVLSSHPSFLLVVPDQSVQRLSSLPLADHELVVPYTSLALRLVCRSTRDLQQFRTLCATAQLRTLHDWEYPVEKGHLFSREALEQLNEVLRKLNWCVAFQVEAFLRHAYIDAKEALQLIPVILKLVKARGKQYVASFLRHIGPQLRDRYVGYNSTQQSIANFLLDAEREYFDYRKKQSITPVEGSLFDALHVVITPTTMFLEGKRPFPERSNRVIRSYIDNHESFLRVSFVDEDGLQFRFDRDVDGPSFIRSRVGKFLLEGLTIGGRSFKFLAYSQSALKEHAVWFVKTFRGVKTGQVVDAARIIKGLGEFKSKDLMHCPARYGARISQAFTATDATLVEVEEIINIPDISTPDQKYDFTDGVGTMSKELARAIWSDLKSSKRRNRNRPKPAALQIRFMGSKGMLSVDYKLKGMTLRLTVCLRPSMVKFDGAESRTIEIARAFDRPGKYYLNRPLIMLLEGLGVPYKTFEYFQDRAVRQVYESTKSLESAARMLESFGLGNSYRLTSVMLSLSKLGVSDMVEDPFYQTMLKYAVHHVLRDLKNHARIPIENAWTLVGVADVHKHLKEGEIFACIKPLDGPTVYLEGDVLISRSPTIHPGDVQIARAIGKPPLDSCFAVEPLRNTVVFSVKGERPLCTILGGGDLDGDIYNLVPLNKIPSFRPKWTYEGASYTAAPRKMVDHQCTMQDVAEFFMDYINSDVLGIIGSTWITIADQSGISDPACIKLAQLHSDAVDFPKSGTPVALGQIPRAPTKLKPDYQAPETVNLDSVPTRFYRSKRAIGRLFRKIDLPELHTEVQLTRRTRQKIREEGQVRQTRGVNALAESLAALEIQDDPIAEAVHWRVFQYLSDEDMILADEEQRLFVSKLFSQYCSELQTVLVVNTLGHARSVLLTEEEAMVGTIAQRSSQPRKRNDQMAKLREQTDILVRGIRDELAGEHDVILRLVRAWLACELGLKERSKKDLIGAQSFTWIALGAVFEVIREIEEQEDPHWY
ncbi:RdRP-domain-containing protein [Dendrothele bispora CBS 962.96]|uniref:RNA-dependent RNA polymerase n=1 Tax=Dendrothele bispora (strain CBS 962.96) TaxID=1314807 RepID=A0A4S8LS99_DENBC|nr:RdRP-domain-containing protein [Dendrothele bispora CBS 962.96]